MITMIGLGRLGTPLAACLAARGYEVVGYDPVPEKVEAVNARRPLAHEPGLEAQYAAAGDRIRATTDLAEAVRASDTTVLAVPTPSGPDGSFSLTHLLPTVREVGAALEGKEGYHVVVVISTVMPGSTDRRIRPALEQSSGRRVGKDLGLAYSAVFVTMGHVVGDFLEPDLALVGESDSRAGAAVEAVYRTVCRNDPPVVHMSPFNAELAKLAVNVFVATKISFANVLARICEQMPGGNVDVVTGAMQLDHRVGKGALCGAIAYGGPFFSRDNQAFATLMRRLEVAPELLEALGRFNRSQVPWLADLIHERVGDGKRVGVLGLAYKPDTDVVDESPSLYLCRRLDERGVAVVAHDPAAMATAKPHLPPAVELARTAQACVEACDLAVLVTPWAVYRSLPPAVWARPGRPRTVVDCWRLVPSLAGIDGVDYVSLGTGPGTPVSGQTSHPPPPVGHCDA